MAEGEEEKVLVKKKCPSCRKMSLLKVSAVGYERWQNGEFVQRAFPELSADDREILISGMCPSCWDATFTNPTGDGEDVL